MVDLFLLSRSIVIPATLLLPALLGVDSLRLLIIFMLADTGANDLRMLSTPAKDGPCLTLITELVLINLGGNFGEL